MRPSFGAQFRRLGGLRVVPLGKTGDAWLRTESGIRPCSYRTGWVGRYTLPPLLQGHPPHPDAPLLLASLRRAPGAAPRSCLVRGGTRGAPRQPRWRLCGVCSAWIRSSYSGAVGKKTVFWLSRKSTTPRKVIMLPGGWSVATLPTSALNPAVGVTCSEAS